MDENEKNILVKNSDNPKADFKDFGFYTENSKYFYFDVKMTRKGTAYSPVPISNFVGKSEFHLVNGNNNSKRIIRIQRNTGQIYTIEIETSEMKPEIFETILKSKQCSFFGNAFHLKQIFVYWMDNEIQAHIIQTLGWNNEHQLYAFANSILKKGSLLEVDEVGIITDPDSKEKFYLPAFGIAQINNNDFEGERKFLYKPGTLDFEAWSQLYFDAFGSNGSICILFLILALHWDIVFDQIGFFPFLFLFGAYGTGKTKSVEFLLRLFGKDFVGIPLDNATQVGLSRAVASRNNAIFYLKEYTPKTDEDNQGFLLTAYDGSGRTTGIKSNDNKTRLSSVKSAIILDGNHLPTQKTAVLSRMVLLNFESNQFTDNQIKAYSKLEQLQDAGFGKVVSEILKHRDYFQKGFKKTFDENMIELREVVKGDFAERTMKHVALLLTPAKLLIHKLKLPFTFSEITNIVFDNAKEQNRLLKQTDEITIFWQAFAYNVKAGLLIQFKNDEWVNNRKEAHFNLKIDESGSTLMQIKLPGIVPDYIKYCKNNGFRWLDHNSLRMLLTSAANPSFIQSGQKGRGNAYTDFYFGTCYQFRLDRKENIFYLNEIELNL